MIDKAIRTAWWVWALVAAALLYAFGFFCVLGWTIGSAISLITVCVYKHFTPKILHDASKAKKLLIKLYLIYLIFILIALSAIVVIWGKSFAFTAGFVCGVTLVQSVIIIRTIGSIIKTSTVKPGGK